MIKLSFFLTQCISSPSRFFNCRYDFAKLLTEDFVDFRVFFLAAVMNLGGTQRNPEKNVTILESLGRYVLGKLQIRLEPDHAGKRRGRLNQIHEGLQLVSETLRPRSLEGHTR